MLHIFLHSDAALLIYVRRAGYKKWPERQADRQVGSIVRATHDTRFRAASKKYRVLRILVRRHSQIPRLLSVSAQTLPPTTDVFVLWWWRMQVLWIAR